MALSSASQTPLAAPAKSGMIAGFRDIQDALKMYRLALTFGWQDVAQRYRRSRVGAFWLTLNMAVFVTALGLIFSTLFQSPIQEFLPYICASVIVWSFISTALADGCSTFVASEGIILQVRMPLFSHVMRVLWRNVIILAHNIVIFPLVILLLGGTLNWSLLYAVPGLLLICLNLSWMMLVLAVLCTRFRDMTQVVLNILQVMFYLTPVMWQAKILPPHVSHLIIDLNPFYHLLQLIRAPLLGQTPAAISWLIVLAMAVIGWAFAVAFFGKYRWRVAYWL